MRHKTPTRKKNEQGFTLTEMLMATVVVIFGLVAVAQLVPTSVMLSSSNRSNGAALVFAQREMEALREQPLAVSTFSDQNGVTCPASTTCNLGDSSKAYFVGCPVVPNASGAPIIDFSTMDFSSGPPVSGYSFSYIDLNDPSGATYNVCWAILTVSTNSGTVPTVTGRRIVVGVFRSGMESPTLPVTLDTLVER